MKTMLKRERITMPWDIRRALEGADATADYNARPAYQRNDYLGWIERAKRPDTRQKRLRQMLRELRQGGIYMNMPHAPSRKASQ